MNKTKQFMREYGKIIVVSVMTRGLVFHKIKKFVDKLIVATVAYLRSIRKLRHFICQNKFIAKYKYVMICLLIIAFYIPYLVHYYPGIMISDTFPQIRQAMNAVRYSNHHPIFQTLMWKLFIFLAHPFHDDNIIVLFNSLFQMICLSAVLTYSLSYLHTKKIKTRLLTLLYLFYPPYAMYSIYTTKDVMFSVAILFFVIELVKLVDTQFQALQKFKSSIPLLLSSMLVMVYKNNGIYIVLASLFCILFCYKEYYKKIGRIIVYLCVFIFLYFNAFFQVLNVKPTEKVESLGIPLIQMSYLVNFYYEELTEEEIREINQYVDIDILKNTYRFNTIDGFKKTFNVEYYEQNKLKFFQLSFNLLKNHPKGSLLAIYNKNKLIFDIRQGYVLLDLTYRDENPLHIVHNDYSKNDIFHQLLYNFLLRHTLYNIRIYFYIGILLFLFCLFKRNHKEYIFIPIFMVYITGIGAPHCVLRYFFPAMLCTPFIIYYIFDSKQISKKIDKVL